MELTPRPEDGHLRFSSSELIDFWERNSARSDHGRTPRKSKREACTSPFELYNIQNEDATINGDLLNDLAPNLDVVDMEVTINICCETDSFSPLKTSRARLSVKRKHSPENSEDRTPIKGRKTPSVVVPRILKAMAPKVIVRKALIDKNAKRNATSSSGPSTSNVFDQNKVVSGENKFAYKTPITRKKRLVRPSIVPKPFSFHSRDTTQTKSVKQETERDFTFTAKAATVLRKVPFIPHTRPRRILDFRAPALRTENRAKKWSEIKLDRESKQRKLDEELVKLEREIIRQIRKTKEFKASGIAWKK